LAKPLKRGGLKQAGRFKGVGKKTRHENTTEGGPCFSVLSMSTEPL